MLSFDAGTVLACHCIVWLVGKNVFVVVQCCPENPSIDDKGYGENNTHKLVQSVSQIITLLLDINFFAMESPVENPGVFHDRSEDENQASNNPPYKGSRASVGSGDVS